jgi:hypothetical protein
MLARIRKREIIVWRVVGACVLSKRKMGTGAIVIVGVGSEDPAQMRTRNESSEPTTDRNAIMPTTVWPWHKKRYTCSAFPAFGQAQRPS